MDEAQLIAYIRLRMGGLGEEEVPDTVFQTFLTMMPAESTDGDKVFKVFQRVIEYRIAQAVNEGAPTRHMEMEGRVIVDKTGMDLVGDLERLLKRWKLSPSLESLGGVTTSGTAGLVLIGGVRNSKIREIENNPESAFGCDAIDLMGRRNKDVLL